MTNKAENSAQKGIGKSKTKNQLRVETYEPVLGIMKEFEPDLSNSERARLAQSIHLSILKLDRNNALRPTEDLYLFLETAKQYGLSPIKKEIYATYRWSKATQRDELIPIVSIHGLRKKARAQRPFRYTRTASITYEYDEKGKLSSATAEVYGLLEGAVEDIKAATFTAYFEEFDNSDEKHPNNWNKMPRVMLGKCAEANAIRMGFGLAGLYIEEEMTGRTSAEIDPTNAIDGETEDE
ncbi:MAG: recombinase RecT [Candidatus Saccharimonadales bacterium]